MQPTDEQGGYAPGKPVGGIELPIVACNDAEGDQKAGNHFKLYTERTWSQYQSYNRKDLHKACAGACMEQFDQCMDVYAHGGHDGGKRVKRGEQGRGEQSQEDPQVK